MGALSRTPLASALLTTGYDPPIYMNRISRSHVHRLVLARSRLEFTPTPTFRSRALRYDFHTCHVHGRGDSLPLPPIQVFENLTDVTSYSYDSAKQELVSYDTPHIASLKAQYVSTKGLGGNMFWDVSRSGISHVQSA